MADMTDKNALDFVIDENQTEPFVITLTDLDTGKDRDFKVVADATIEGKRYFALIPADEKTEDCFVLSVHDDGESLVFETIEDDEEYEMVEDYFNDLLFNENDYDN